MRRTAFFVTAAAAMAFLASPAIIAAGLPRVIVDPRCAVGRRTGRYYERRNRGKDYRGSPGYGKQEAARRLGQMERRARWNDMSVTPSSGDVFVDLGLAPRGVAA